MQIFLAACSGAAIALAAQCLVAAQRDGLFVRRPKVPKASVISRAQKDQKADLRRVLKGSRVTTWWSA